MLGVAVVGGLAGSLFLGCGRILGIEVVSGDEGAVESGVQAEAGTGVTILASHIGVPPNRIVSDGTSLFWTTFQSSPGLLSMPVGGGTITTLLNAQTTTSQGGVFLAVDDVNVYVIAETQKVPCTAYSLMRIPKNGGATTLVNDTPATLSGATSLGDTAYWFQDGDGLCGPPTNQPPNAFKSSALLGGPVTTFASDCVLGNVIPSSIAVTSSTVVYDSACNGAFYFPLGGCPPANLHTDGSQFCTSLTSDTAAVYCASPTLWNLRIASDGTFMPLGQVVNSSYIVFDDTYVYWADNTTDGAIKKTPKAGGGDTTVLAWDTNPTAVGIDANSIYWGDQAGYMKSIPR
jgi:hypothetical protein